MLDITTQTSLIIVDKLDYEVVANQQFLSNVLKASKLDQVNDVKILVVDIEHPILLGSELDKVKSVLVFGVNPKYFGLNMNPKIYKIFTFEKMQLMIFHKIGDIANDQQKKQILWKVLQHHYIKA